MSKALARALDRASRRQRVLVGSRAWLSTAAIDLGVIALIWLLLAALAQPFGEFPLDDDWSYSRSVEILLHQGRFNLVFAAMPLGAQVIWGSLFCLPFGFSFTALHVSTWVLGLIGLVATYGLLKTVAAPRPVALLGTLLLAANPIYFVLSLTFMTDVPFLTLSVTSIAVLAKALQHDRRFQMALGIILAFIALLIRQPAMAILIGFCIAYLIVRPLTLRAAVVALTPAAIGYAILTGYEFVVRRTIGLPPLYNRPYDPILETTPFNLLNISWTLVSRVGLEFLYLGVFVLPLCLLVAAIAWRGVPVRARWLIGASGAAVVAIGLALGLERSLPFGNVLYDIGLGPPLLRDVYVLALPHLPQAPQVLWVAVWCAAVGGTTLLALKGAHLVLPVIEKRFKRPGATSAPVLLCAAAGGAYVGFSAVAGFLDRYLIWLVPLAMVLVCAGVGARPSIRFGWPMLVGGSLFAVYGIFSVAATHDYFAWNRSRWLALNHLTQDLHISTAEIDGGFEFNGWYGYSPGYREHDDLSWWWVQGDEYVVAFGQVDGYVEISSYPYDRWLPPGQDQILILRRAATSRQTPIQ